MEEPEDGLNGFLVEGTLQKRPYVERTVCERYSSCRPFYTTRSIPRVEHLRWDLPSPPLPR